MLDLSLARDANYPLTNSARPLRAASWCKKKREKDTGAEAACRFTMPDATLQSASSKGHATEGLQQPGARCSQRVGVKKKVLAAAICNIYGGTSEARALCALGNRKLGE